MDGNAEKVIIVVAYISMASVVFEEVVRRFFFSSQLAWSTTIPVYLFILITWTGAAYNIRTRTHLAFTELRSRMPYKVQFVLRLTDSMLWIVLAAIVIFYGSSQIDILRLNYAVVPGTDNVMQWWFYLFLPFGWSLIALRVFQNVLDDIRKFRAGEAFIVNQAIIAD